MRHPSQIIMLALFTLGVQGCAPLLLAGGLVALSAVDQDLRKQEHARKVENSRLENLRHQAEAQQRQRQQEELRWQQIVQAERRKAEEAERSRAAELAQRQQEELRRRQLASAERQRQEQAAQQQRAEYERSRQAETRRAQELISAIEEELAAARWSRSRLPDLARAVSAIDHSAVSQPTAARLHLALGLYAYLNDDLALARQQWLLAKGDGLDNPRVVAGALWTPGAAEAFANAH
jgi:hypothetical protein